MRFVTEKPGVLHCQASQGGLQCHDSFSHRRQQTGVLCNFMHQLAHHLQTHDLMHVTGVGFQTTAGHGSGVRLGIGAPEPAVQFGFFRDVAYWAVNSRQSLIGRRGCAGIRHQYGVGPMHPLILASRHAGNMGFGVVAGVTVGACVRQSLKFILQTFSVSRGQLLPRLLAALQQKILKQGGIDRRPRQISLPAGRLIRLLAR